MREALNDNNQKQKEAKARSTCSTAATSAACTQKQHMHATTAKSQGADLRSLLVRGERLAVRGVELVAQAVDRRRHLLQAPERVLHETRRVRLVRGEGRGVSD
jgi:hypothetical protein